MGDVFFHSLHTTTEHDNQQNIVLLICSFVIIVFHETLRLIIKRKDNSLNVFGSC